MFYSPLRYPGGKGRLASFMALLIEQYGKKGGVYIEPFAGGAGIALELLDKNIVSEIVINDLDKGIYSFWRAILEETDKFIEKVQTVPLTIEEWNIQREICFKRNKKYSFELGFATFYMNRTNRSGIIKGGVIGGISQSSTLKMDARFNRENLVHRIEKIVKHKSKIHIYNKDVESFIKNYLPKYEDRAFIYFDPPYFMKGKELYLNFFNINDHVRIKNLINRYVNCSWVVTYDDTDEIKKIYSEYPINKFDLSYSVANKRKASEIIIFKSMEHLPDLKSFTESIVKINLRLDENENLPD